MNKGLVWTGVGIMALSAILALIGTLSAGTFEPSDETIIHRSSGTSTFNYDIDETFLITVYAEGDVSCTNTEVSIYDDEWEYFVKDCEPAYDTDDYTYLGDAVMDYSGQFAVDSSTTIVLVNEDSLATDGFMMIGGCCLFVLGLILLIIGLATGGAKNQSVLIMDPTMMQGQIIVPQQTQMVMPQQTQMGQPHYPQQQVAPQPIHRDLETTVEHNTETNYSTWDNQQSAACFWRIAASFGATTIWQQRFSGFFSK